MRMYEEKKEQPHAYEKCKRHCGIRETTVMVAFTFLLLFPYARVIRLRRGKYEVTSRPREEKRARAKDARVIIRV